MMRDIKRNSGYNKKVSLPPLDMGKVEEIELFEASQASKERIKQINTSQVKAGRTEGKKAMDLGGKTVPLANVKTEEPLSDINESEEVKKEERRPLFAKSPLVKRQHVWMGKGERKIMIGLIGLVIIAALISSIIFLPTATINLKLRTAPLLADEEVLIGQANDNNKVIPGTSFYREIGTKGSWQVQNREVIGSKSSGTVEVVNNTSTEQKIKEFSRLETKDGILFYMQKHAIVPPNGRVQVEVLAAEEGDAGNIEPQRLDFVAFDEQSKQVVWADVKQKLTGGSGESVAVVGAADLTAARQEAGNQARQQAEQQIKDELPEGWELLEESWNTEIVSFEAASKEGDKLPVFDWQSQVVVRVIGFEKVIFDEEMKKKLEERLDKDYMLFPGAISFSVTVKEINWDDAQATVAVRVTHSTVPNLAVDTLRQKLAGRSLVEAREYLEGLPGVRSADIQLWPFWVKSIPRIEKRVDIQLESEKKI
jgi:hypothetical protein